MAMQFAAELRAAARQTGNLGDRSLNELRDILSDTLAKVRTDVFGAPGAAPAEGSPSEPTDQSADDGPDSGSGKA
jgi:hypothetical protein